MKRSTLALGALLSFSINALAQDKPKVVSNAKNTKTEKPNNCVKPKTKNKHVAKDTLSLNEPEHRSPKYCPACGRG